MRIYLLIIIYKERTTEKKMEIRINLPIKNENLPDLKKEFTE